VNDDDLAQLRAALLDDLRIDLGPDQGREAFGRHQLLAIRFARASRLNVAGLQIGEQNGWIRYFEDHFPRGSEHAKRLFEKWRTTLVKDEMPGRGVAITHGQPQAHWQITASGLVVDLESMWDDFEASVDRFLAEIEADDEHRSRVLSHFEKTRWTVQPVEIVVPLPRVIRPAGGSQIITPAVSASSASVTATAITPDAPVLPDTPDRQT